MNNFNNNTTAMNNATVSFAKGRILIMGTLVLSFLVFSSFKKEENTGKVTKATTAPAIKDSKYGTIYYTLTDGTDIRNSVEALTDDSYCLLGKQSVISIANNDGKFSIGILQDGTFTNNSSHMLWAEKTGNTSDYSVAKYVTSNEDKTQSAASFQEGAAKIISLDEANHLVTIAFNYRMRSRETNNFIMLKGFATVHILH